LPIGIGAGVVLQFLFTCASVFQSLFETEAIPVWVWPRLLLLGGFVFFAVVEPEKLIIAFAPACASVTVVKVRAAIPGANAPSSSNCPNGVAAGIFSPATVKKQAHIKAYTKRKKVMRLDAAAGAAVPAFMVGALT
jgi:hypothetical protein